MGRGHFDDQELVTLTEDGPVLLQLVCLGKYGGLRDEQLLLQVLISLSALGQLGTQVLGGPREAKFCLVARVLGWGLVLQL